MSTAVSTTPIINPAALEPLFANWEEPNAHRIRAEVKGGAARVVKGRRTSRITIAQNLRGEVHEWREMSYVGASDTARQLLAHWFGRPHRMATEEGGEYEFRYYFCQQEAIETLIYLKEVRKIEYLSQLVAEFGGPDAETAALGITEEEDAWSRYAFKMATGTGKTKVMSLAIVWSYFHALRESDSTMARHFVVIAPNLTVYERLKEDFGDGKIFDTDPLIPVEWLGDWNFSVVLQDETGGVATGGTLYLTNIHRLYDISKRKRKGAADTYDFIGPAVSKASALDTGAALRDRITSHQRVMVLNDEAHHLWDPDSAWNEAIQYLHETIKSRTGGDLVCQLDFSATPKDNKGQSFKHIICDSPLGEAVDGGIVKTPIIGKADRSLSEEPSDNAAYRYDRHLRLGYERWRRSKQEWEKSGKKALLFVMCEDTEAADQIATRLNTDDTFEELKGKTINLHTNLKGKVKKIGRGPYARIEFVENEKQISDEDLKALRKLSRELDQNSSQYHCIVSVLMLREGWDVRNVTTIVPLRPYSSKANILPEQTLGRGLRRMTPSGSDGANEIVTVVEHPAFASLYLQELAQEGLPLEIVDIDHVPATTISIYPDVVRKDVTALEIEIPRLTPGHRVLPKLEGLTIEDVKKEFSKYKPLLLGSKGAEEVDYEGRHLFTNEVIERMKIHLPLLESGLGAVSYYIKQLEQICRLRNLHAALAPLLETFLQEVLFDKKASLFDDALIARLGNADVSEHIRAVFVPLIRVRTTTVEERVPTGKPVQLSNWRPYQVTHSERRPALEAGNTLFNLVPCNRELEVAMTKFLDRAHDVKAFAKNAGYQCLRIDYLASGSRLAFYTPDFFVRTSDGHYYLVETKGQEDREVPRKAQAAVAWCESASTRKQKWEYIYVPQGVFERLTGDSVAELASMCRPALQELLRELDGGVQTTLFTSLAEEAPEIEEIVDQATLQKLPSRYKGSVEQAATTFQFYKKKEGMDYSPVFQALLGAMDEAARGLILRRLQPELPAAAQDRKAWFDPYLDMVDPKSRTEYEMMARNLKKTLVFNNGISPISLLRSCLDYAQNETIELGGVFVTIRSRFGGGRNQGLLSLAKQVNAFRNNYVAHQKEQITDANRAKEELKAWINALLTFSGME